MPSFPSPETELTLAYLFPRFSAFPEIGNALLIIRFSSNSPSIRALAVEAPLMDPWINTVVEIVNLSVLSFVALLALQALVFSCIEGWTFFDGTSFLFPSQTALRTSLMLTLLAVSFIHRCVSTSSL